MKILRQMPTVRRRKAQLTTAAGWGSARRCELQLELIIASMVSEAFRVASSADTHKYPGLKGHIMHRFPMYYRLFEVLYHKKREATPDELDIIRGKTLVSEGWANQYISDLESVNNNIRKMFEKQAAASLVRS
jgi:hypothetical protein